MAAASIILQQASKDKSQLKFGRKASCLIVRNSIGNASHAEEIKEELLSVKENGRSLSLIERKRSKIFPDELKIHADTIGKNEDFTTKSCSRSSSRQSEKSQGKIIPNDHGKIKESPPPTPHQHAEAVNELKRQLSIPAYIIQPDSPFLYKWKLIILIFLVYAAIVTPYEIAFYPVQFSAYFLVDCIMNTAFAVDIGINFFCSFYHQNKHSQRHHVTSLWLIAHRYLHGSFCVDLASALPVMLVPLLWESHFTARYSFLRMVRLARLPGIFRLLQVLKSARKKPSYLEQRLNLNYAVLALTKYCLLVLVIGHWTACLWGWVAHISESYNNTWIGGLCTDCDLNALVDIQFELYSTSLYFSIMTITSIGYGNIIPMNMIEHWACVIMMLLGASVWAYTIGNASSIIATMGSDTAEYNRLMDILDSHIKKHMYSKEMKKELYQYFRAYKPLIKRKISSEVVKNMSPHLQYLVTRWNNQWTDKVKWTTALSPPMLTMIVTHMEGRLYCQGESMASKNHLSSMISGVGSRCGRVLVKGSSWGHDMILSSELLMEKTSSKAITYCEIITISRENFFKLFEHHPEDLKEIRKWAIYICLRRAMRLLGIVATQNWIVDSNVIQNRMRLRSEAVTSSELAGFLNVVSSLRTEASQRNSAASTARIRGARYNSSLDSSLNGIEEISHSVGPDEFEKQVRKELLDLKRNFAHINEIALQNSKNLQEIKGLILRRQHPR